MKFLYSHHLVMTDMIYHHLSMNYQQGGTSLSNLCSHEKFILETLQPLHNPITLHSTLGITLSAIYTLSHNLLKFLTSYLTTMSTHFSSTFETTPSRANTTYTFKTTHDTTITDTSNSLGQDNWNEVQHELFGHVFSLALASYDVDGVINGPWQWCQNWY